MSQRKQYIIDKKFQLKTTFSIIGMVTIITAIIILAIASNVVYNNEKIENIHEIQDNIVQFLTARTLGAEDEAFKNAIKEIEQNHRNNMRTLKKIMMYNKYLLIAIFLFVIAESIILYIILIRKTHRISGPIYVMSNYIKEIIDGKYPVPRSLRNKDELQDFYELFKTMVEKLREEEK